MCRVGLGPGFLLTQGSLLFSPATMQAIQELHHGGGGAALALHHGGGGAGLLPQWQQWRGCALIRARAALRPAPARPAPLCVPLCRLRGERG